MTSKNITSGLMQQPLWGGMTMSHHKPRDKKKDDSNDFYIMISVRTERLNTYSSRIYILT